MRVRVWGCCEHDGGMRAAGRALDNLHHRLDRLLLLRQRLLDALGAVAPHATAALDCKTGMIELDVQGRIHTRAGAVRQCCLVCRAVRGHLGLGKSQHADAQNQACRV